MKKILLTAAAVMLGVAMTTVSYAGGGCGGCQGDAGADKDTAKESAPQVQALR